MAKFDNKKALVGLGVLGVAGIAGAAFAASVTIDNSNAGQGAEVVDGFTVTNIGYDATPKTDEAQANTVQVSFDIARDGQTQVVADDNAEVYVQLRDDTVRSDWASCTVTAGKAVCALTADETMKVQDVDGISVVAFDIYEN